MPIDVFVADEQDDHPVDAHRWAQLARAVLVGEGLRGEVELSLLFVDEAAISELNKRFLDRDGPTDVLAFPIDEEPLESGRSPDSGGTGPGLAPEPEEMEAKEKELLARHYWEVRPESCPSRTEAGHGSPVVGSTEGGPSPG
jgi:hypothetical protein